MMDILVVLVIQVQLDMPDQKDIRAVSAIQAVPDLQVVLVM